MSSPLKVLVAGATGVIGRRVVTLLREEGHEVVGLTRSAAKAPALSALGAEPVVADAYDLDRVLDVVASAAPDVVIHQLTDLGSADVTANARLRRDGTANLVAACRAAAVPRMVAQSIAWAYAPTPGPADERNPLDLTADEPRRTTVEGVAALEAAIREMPEGVVLRYGTLYGPDTWFESGSLRAEAATRGDLAADLSVTSFVHVDDAASAAVQALEWQPGTYNVVDDEPAAGEQWVPDFCRFVGVPTPEPSAQRVPWASGATNASARRQGWHPIHPTWRGNWGAGSAGAHT